ncbi:MAG: hypothetical protein F9K23_00785 [Bacteroidetes bacterium]|nr:MAG: hypothetical protein F9K23_00785 [Bacteroidota bacterium]
MSIKKNLFLALQEQLRTVDRMQWVDKNMGQVRLLDDTGALVPMPAVLIEFSEAAYARTGAGVQRGQCVVRFTVLYENYADSHADSTNKDVALRYFDFTEAVYKALEGFEYPGCTPLTRMGEEEDNDHSNFIVTNLIFATEITDDSAAQKTIPLGKSLEVNATFKTPSSRPEDTTKTDFVIP